MLINMTRLYVSELYSSVSPAHARMDNESHTILKQNLKTRPEAEAD